MPREVQPAFLRHEVVVLPVVSYVGVADGNTAITILDTFKLGYRAAIEKLRFVSSSIATGAAATLSFELRKGGPTGTVIAQLDLALADVSAVGKFKEVAVAAASADTARLFDTDGFSITRKATGTAFTKLEGAFSVVVRQMPQARQ